jgi:hypothetical protein
MRTISASLLAAQKAASGEPYVSVIAENSLQGVTRLDYAQVNSAAHTSAKHGAAVAADGSLQRVRIDAGTVYHQRVATPGTPWSDTWTSLAAAMHTVIAVAAISTRVCVMYCAADKRSLKIRESTDSGQTFAAEVAVVTVGADVNDIGIAYKNAGGDLAIVWAHAASFGIMKRTAGAFGAGVTGALTPASISGIALLFKFDWNIAVTGVESVTNKPTVWTTTYGDGVDQAVNTWGTAMVQQQAESDASVTYAAPSLAFIGTYRLTFVEADAFSGGATRTYRSHLVFSLFWVAGDFTWRTPAPVNWTDANGLAICADASWAYESSHSGVWRASRAIVTLDLSAAVLQCEVVESAGELRGHIDIDNTSGAYAGPPAPLKLGNTIAISWG